MERITHKNQIVNIEGGELRSYQVDGYELMHQIGSPGWGTHGYGNVSYHWAHRQSRFQGSCSQRKCDSGSAWTFKGAFVCLRKKRRYKGELPKNIYRRHFGLQFKIPG